MVLRSAAMRATMKPALCALLVFAACGPTTRPPGGDDGVDAAGSGSGSNGDNCSAAAKLIYVVDSNNTLSKFEPVSRTFQDIGKLSCPSQLGATPFSMGIDRNATAWVLYSSGELFRVDTTNLNCTKTTWSGAAQGLM